MQFCNMSTEYSHMTPKCFYYTFKNKGSLLAWFHEEPLTFTLHERFMEKVEKVI